MQVGMGCGTCNCGSQQTASLVQETVEKEGEWKEVPRFGAFGDFHH